MHRRPLRTSLGRTLDARRDTLDFRDQMYVPPLVEVPVERPLADYRAWRVPVLDQQRDGACTGFGLATVAHYLLRVRRVTPDRRAVSPWMLYDLARRYDEWPDADGEGSSIRGALKGWHKHGVCGERLWTCDGPSDAAPSPVASGRRRAARSAARLDPWADALDRPLGAYYRVNHQDLVAMHVALAEVGVLYASADVHDGWDDVGTSGRIPDGSTLLGAHAFAIVAYDRDGFWIQNSWGRGWGHDGFGHLSYDDWLAHGTDVWVARLGAPLRLTAADAVATATTSQGRGTRAAAIRDVRPHVVSVGNDGRLRAGGEYGTDAASLARRFADDIPATMARWARPRLLLYAHGGLVDEASAVARIAAWRGSMLEREVYPLAFVWRTDYWTTLRDILQDAFGRRRAEGVLDATKDFMLDRLDDALEPLARALSGRAAWAEMKENALAASAPGHAAALVVDGIAALRARVAGLEVHLAAHSAGAILLAPVVAALAGDGTPPDESPAVASCTLWAPACTMALFEERYLPALERGRIGRLALYSLTERAEQDDDCAGIYHKSLLHLVSNAFEDTPRIPLFRDGVPLLGMEKFVRASPTLGRLFAEGRAFWVRAPNAEDEGSPTASAARRHGDFDDDRATLAGTLERITGAAAPVGAFTMRDSGPERASARRALDEA